MTRFAPLVLGSLLVAGLLGCQDGQAASSGPTTAGSSAPAAVSEQQILAIGRQYAQCLRDHGIPTFPDMVVLGGRLAVPDNAAGDAAEQALRANPDAARACQSILANLPPSAQKNAEVSPDDLQALLKFAQCLREHGVAGWPDPNPQGAFPISGTPLADEIKSPQVQSAIQACWQFWAGGISVK
jgi:hypothetical protein